MEVHMLYVWEILPVYMAKRFDDEAAALLADGWKPAGHPEIISREGVDGWHCFQEWKRSGILPNAEATESQPGAGSEGEK